MNITSTIITSPKGEVLSLYDICCRLSTQQWKHIIERLQEEGINVKKIEAYEYPEAKEIKHLFIHFKETAEEIPYFLLPTETFKKITACIIEEFS